MMTTAIASNNLGFPKAMPLEVRVMKTISTSLRIYSTWLVMINKHVVGQQYGSTKNKKGTILPGSFRNSLEWQSQ